MKIKVLVASRSYLFRAGMIATLAPGDWASEMCEADSDDELVKIWMRGRPGLTILDETTVDAAAFTAYQRHIDPAASVVVVTDEENRETLSRTLRLGAAGYLPSTAGAEDILHCMERVISGGRFVPATFESQQQEDQLLKALSPRQVEILSLMASGCTNRTIASLLSIGPETVKTHVRYICQKLGVQKRISAIMTAQRLGILDVGR